MNRVIVPALVLHHHPVTSTGSHHQRINIRPGFAVDRPTIKSSAATGDFLEDEVEALVRFRNRSTCAKDSVVPSARRRLRPLGLSVLVRVLDHNTHTYAAHIVFYRTEHPHSRLFHLDDRVDALCGGQYENRYCSRDRDRV